MFSYILGQLGFFYSLIIVLLLLLCTKVSSSSVPSSSSSCPSIDLESTSASLFWVETFQCNTKKDDTEKGDTKSNELNDIHGNIYGNWYTSKKHLHYIESSQYVSTSVPTLYKTPLMDQLMTKHLNEEKKKKKNKLNQNGVEIDEYDTTKIDIDKNSGIFVNQDQKSILGSFISSLPPSYCITKRKDDSYLPMINLGQDKSLTLENSHKHYGVVYPFQKPLVPSSKVKNNQLVLQYEVKNDEIVTCGGAYIKLFDANAVSSKDLQEGNFDQDTPYIIMFGPDRCGSTNLVHFILRFQNPVTGEWEEKHAQGTPGIKVDKRSHLYTLIVNQDDNSFFIKIDNEIRFAGNLLEDMLPPILPPEYIDDPEDKKPETWVDEEMIEDIHAKKPDDWDENEPQYIPDSNAIKPSSWLENEEEYISNPEATKPEDWDDEEDGIWEAPLIENPLCAPGSEAAGCGVWTPPNISNPKYKGKWKYPLIPNPEYIGEWKPKQIKNPNFFTLENVDDENNNDGGENNNQYPSILKHINSISGVAIEILTNHKGVHFDNFFIGSSDETANQFASLYWKPKYEMEVLYEDKLNNPTLESPAEYFSFFVEFIIAFIKDLPYHYRDDPNEVIFSFAIIIGLIISFIVIIRSIVYKLFLKTPRPPSSTDTTTTTKGNLPETEKNEKNTKLEDTKDENPSSSSPPTLSSSPSKSAK